MVPCSRREGRASEENKGHSLCVQSVNWVLQSPQLGGIGERQHKFSRGTPAIASLNNNAGGGPTEFGCIIYSQVRRA